MVHELREIVKIKDTKIVGLTSDNTRLRKENYELKTKMMKLKEDVFNAKKEA